VLALLFVAIAFLKLNSTASFQRILVPIRIGLVYIQGACRRFSLPPPCQLLSVF